MESNSPLEDDSIVLSVMSRDGFLFQCPQRGFFNFLRRLLISYATYAWNIYEDILLKMSLRAPYNFTYKTIGIIME